MNLPDAIARYLTGNLLADEGGIRYTYKAYHSRPTLPENSRVKWV